MQGHTLNEAEFFLLLSGANPSATGGHARDVLHFVERVSDIDFPLSEASRNS